MEDDLDLQCRLYLERNIRMRRIMTAFLLLGSIAAFAQSGPIRKGANVYIEPAYGYEAYLTAAFAEKGVPMVLVTDRKLADYILTGVVKHQSLQQTTSGSYTMVDAKTQQVVFTFTTSTGHSVDQDKSVAEACAKHLKEVIDKQK